MSRIGKVVNSGTDGRRHKCSLGRGESLVLARNGILVPRAMCLPSGWNVSVGGLDVPPLPSSESSLRALIRVCRLRFTAAQLADPAFDEEGAR